MKKGLLSILAGALLVVGCQNYDDQFDQLENQITALSQTVAGLAQVQSDLASLAGTVNSLQSSLSSQIDTALADGLADIDAAVADLEAATADAASADAVQEIADAVAENQTDLEELLAQSTVFTGDVLINSTATLDAYHAMGDNLAIVNGNVTINPDTTMDMAKVQEVADVILTVTKDISITSGASTIAEIVFNNLTGAATLTLEQAGGYHFPVLKSAAKISLSDKYESTITRVNFPALTSVTSIGTDSYTGGVVEFTKATEMSFAALPRYGASLSFTTKKGKADAATTLDIGALRDVDTAGEVSALALSITGPSSVVMPTLDGKGGSITLEDVISATVNDYDGSFVINGGVETFVANNVVELSGTMSDVVTLDIKGAIDPNDTKDKSGPAISLDGKADLATLHLDGNLASVAILNNGNLETLLLKPTLVVNNGIVNVDTNSDLENVTMTGASTSGITFNANNSLVNLTVDATYIKTLATGATLDGSIIVTDNTDLESLTLKGTDVSILTVTGNVDLETINGTELTTLGATAKSNNVTISGNKFVASIAQDKTNATGCTKCADLDPNDLGGFTTTSGMATMKTYLALVAANTSATASVYFDTVESTTNATGVETTGETTGQNDTTVILALTAEVATAAKGDIAAKRVFLVDMSEADAGDKIGLTLNGVDVFSNGTAASTAGSVTFGTNKDLLIADIKSTANVARAAAFDIVLNAARGGNSTGSVSLVQYTTAGGTSTILGQRYTTTTANAAAVSSTNYGFGIDDTLTLTVGGNSVTVSPNTGGATTLTGLGDMLVTAWTSKYGTSGTASASAVATITNTAGKLTITMLDKGTPGYAVDVNLSVGAGTVTATNAKNIDYVIGTTRLENDDATDDTDVVVWVESADAGTLQNRVSGVTTATSNATSATWVELTTSALANATNPNAGIQLPANETADARNAENGSPKNVTTAAQSKTRVHWLG